MSSGKRIDLICIIGIILGIVITVLFINGSAFGIRAVADEDAESYTGNEYFTVNDQIGDVDVSSACMITIDGTDGKVSGNGAYFLRGDLVISGGGKYLISGKLDDGCIIVDAYSSSKVWLILDGVSINCSDGPAVYVKQADKVFMTLRDGSENILTSGEEFGEDPVADGAGGTIYTHDDLTINGSGSLNITAKYKHGIDANDSLHITGGYITVTAVADAIHVNDELNFAGTEMVIEAGDDALHSDSVINILGGEMVIDDCYEGLEAKIINVEDGDITIYPVDDGLNANGNNRGFGPPMAKDVTSEADDVTEEETYISISGGNITIENSTARDADGLDSNGDIYISGGVIRISMIGDSNNTALDFGSESGGQLIVTGGEIIACGSSSMAEAFSDSSTQCAALINLDETLEAGELLTVTDADGQMIMSYEVPCSYDSVSFSSPALTSGGTYTVSAGGLKREITFEGIVISDGSADGFGGRGMGGGGKPPEGMEFDGERPEPPEGMEFDGRDRGNKNNE